MLLPLLSKTAKPLMCFKWKFSAWNEKELKVFINRENFKLFIYLSYSRKI